MYARFVAIVLMYMALPVSFRQSKGFQDFKGFVSFNYIAFLLVFKVVGTEAIRNIYNIEAKDKNYFSDNLLIKFLLKNFISKLSSILRDIKTPELYGLDIGTTKGHLLSFFFQKSVLRKVTAIDISMVKLLYARNNYPFFNFLQGDIHLLPFKNHIFDYIIANEVLEHVEDPFLAMKEFRRVCKKNSLVILSVPYEPFFSIGNLLRGKYMKNKGRTPSHKHFWKKKEFERFINQFVTIKQAYSLSVFPWLLYVGQLKNTEN